MMNWNRSNRCRALPRRLAAGFICAAFLLTVGSAVAAPLPRLEIPSQHTFQETLKRLRASIKQNRMGLVNTANAQAGARAIGVTIRGNQVWGVFSPRFAVRMLKASNAAGFEAPVRLYITEAAGGRVAVSYVKPSLVFGQYGISELDAMGRELDEIFARITAVVW